MGTEHQHGVGCLCPDESYSERSIWLDEAGFFGTSSIENVHCIVFLLTDRDRKGENCCPDSVHGSNLWLLARL